MLEKPNFTASLSVEHISATYNGHLILEDVSLSVPAGQVTALIGPNEIGRASCRESV